LLEFPLFLINAAAVQLLFFEFFESLFFFPLFEILGIVRPLVSAFLALLQLKDWVIVLCIGCIAYQIRLGSKLAFIFILVNSSAVIVMAPFIEI
jgi:hypothetical protein